MNEITVLSYAKINLSIDVGGIDENGYHAVDMIMQQVDFSDYVKVGFVPAGGSRRGGNPDASPQVKSARGKIEISLRTNRYYLPVDERNLAHKAARIMIDRYGSTQKSGRVEINIKKRIPVAAGLAGGSGNGAAVVHALNLLWGLKLPLVEIMEICSELGSDVPFSAVGQARANRHFPAYLRKDPMAAACVRATGRGTVLEPVRPLNARLVIAKPRISVSTAEVYRGIDRCEIGSRPDNDRLQARLNSGEGSGAIFEDFVNVLEAYTLEAYPQVGELKRRMEDMGARKVLMSGSGPTVFAVCATVKEARRLCSRLRGEGYEAYWMRTTR
jgi:4-diphosphocytidyl-2-C-methyl-D-erythritol kinase